MLVTLLELLNAVDPNVHSLNVPLCLEIVSHSRWVCNPSHRRILSQDQAERRLSISSSSVQSNILGVISLQLIIMFEQAWQGLSQPWEVVFVKNWFVIVIRVELWDNPVAT